MYFPEYSGQSDVEVFSTLSPKVVLYDLLSLWTDLGCEPGIAFSECKPQPDIEEICKLGVIDVSDIGRIGDHDVKRSGVFLGKTVGGPWYESLR